MANYKSSYQKLKKENEILWGELESWIEMYFELRTAQNDEDVQSGRISPKKELAYIKSYIEENTK